MEELVAMSFNYRNSVEWIIGAYEGAGIDFPNGFQKDAIQNAVGARVGSKWTNWRCDISVVTNHHGTFVVVEDSGTCGLTGSNKYIPDVIHEFIDITSDGLKFITAGEVNASCKISVSVGKLSDLGIQSNKAFS